MTSRKSPNDIANLKRRHSLHIQACTTVITTRQERASEECARVRPRYIDPFLHSPYGGKKAQVWRVGALLNAIMDGGVKIEASATTVSSTCKSFDSKPRDPPAVNQGSRCTCSTRAPTSLLSCQKNDIMVEAHVFGARSSHEASRHCRAQ